MSGIPPQLDTSPGTPSQDWARSTTTAAFSRAEPAPALAPGAIPPSSSNPPQIAAPTLAPGSVPPTTEGVSISSASDANKGTFDPEMVPGAYPVTPGDQDPTRQTSLKEVTQTAAGHATNLAGQASNLVSSAAHTAAQYLPQGVVDTVSSMMPTSSATPTMNTARASEHDAEHKTSFPSSEVTGASSGEHVGGVGSLPGFVNESAVPKLPHERTDDERYITSAGAAAAVTSAASTVAGGVYTLKDQVVGSAPSTEQAKQTAQGAAQTVQNTAQSAAQTAKQTLPGTGTKSHNTAVTASTLPAHEPFGAQPGDHSLGVGSLPGTQSETNVALLPEESAHPQYDSGAIDTRAQVNLKPSEESKGNEASFGAARHVAGVGALVGDRSEEGVARLPDEQRTQDFKPSTTSEKAPVPPMKDIPAAKQEVHPSGNKDLPNKNQLRGDPGTGHFAAKTQGGEVERDEEVDSTQADQLHATLRPRAHAFGGERAWWGDVPLNGERARAELDADADDRDYRPRGEGTGYDTDYHPAQIHPREEHYKEPSDHAAEGEKSDAVHTPDQQRQPNATAASGHKKEKASFMDKMKGEAKVLIGKIEGKHEKVEQGQRMKSGEAKSGQA
ncbi:hypothetical protein OH76DRAFT_1480304 [Lentinus brumalis]|uniref:CsbD-like domain-containing protein n=1 Tax=Lentinus brumalis TaxID=2498619 RepID=A0A371DJG5_9APHY|nr:hypothetical protein OH76DRAFT_1480304 [Polyporus brumalis]